MSKRTCLIEECGKPVRARGLCQQHWSDRSIREQYPPLWGKASPDFAAKHADTCSVADCDRRATVRGMCSTHYKRWRLTGEIGGPIEVRTRNKGMQCSVEVCDRPASERGYCDGHYQVWRKGDDLNRPIARVTDRLSVVTYSGMHARLKRDFGYASEHRCADCGAPAIDWSYDNQDPEELRDSESGQPYSLDAARYAPRCRTCHIRYDRLFGRDAEAFLDHDLNQACVRGHAWTPENVYINSRGYRECRSCRLEANRRRRAREAGR